VRASALDWQGNYLEAEAAVKQALALDPNNPDAHAYYSEILTDEYITAADHQQMSLIPRFPSQRPR